MADAATATTDTAAATAAAATAAAAAAAATAAAPWHQGVDAEFLGHWQNKGWKTDDPKDIAINATKQARELEKHIGIPADQIVKMPKAGAPEADIKAFRERLGMPKEAKDYDLSTIKDAAGNPISQAFADAMRNAAHQAGVPKDALVPLAAAIQKSLDDARAAESAVATSTLDAEKAKLKTDWGPNYEFNHLKAMEGARRLGITPAGVAALEKVIGYADTMNAMRKVGVIGSEDVFIERGAGSNGSPTTREGATARLAELRADPAWVNRLLTKDAATVREWTALEQQIAGETLGF